VSRAWPELPSLPGHWLLGHQPELSRDLCGFLMRLRPLGAAVAFRMGPMKAVLLNDPALIQSLMVDNAQSLRLAPSLRMSGRRLFGKSVLAGDEPEHGRQRRVLAPAVSPARHPAPGEDMARHAAAWILRLQKGGEIDAGHEMYLLALQAAASSMFRKELDAEEAGALASALHRLIEQLRLVSLKPWTEWLLLLSPAYRRDLALLRNRVAAMLETPAGDGKPRLVDELQGPKTAAWSGTERQAAALNMLLASSDTTAASLAWTLWLLAGHPAEQESLRGALKKGEAEGGAAAKRVIQESLRLRPPVWMLGRQLLKPLTLGTLSLPKGMQVYCSQLLMHSDPRYFKDPESFSPSRWLEEPELARFAYFPFGFGPRACIGEAFAYSQLQAALKAVLGSFRLERAAEEDPGLKPFITLQPSSPLRLRLERLA
jgi:cytochrome P450